MKYVSILGDSISTYEGYNPPGYAIYYDKILQRRNHLSSANDTWWAKVLQALDVQLCVNNSYSGSRVTGNAFPAASSEERTKNLHTETHSPDMILVYMGFNDFGYGVKIKKGGIRRFMGKDLSTFKDAYAYMLLNIKKSYPSAKIVCGTLMRSRMRYNDAWIFPESFRGVAFENYNIVIRDICKKQKCVLADIASLNAKYETLDGSHPTIEGHSTLANAWKACLKSIYFPNPSFY